MVVDPEEEYFAAEVDKLQVDLEQRGLSLLVVADWYNPRVVERARFFDVSTRSWWTPITGSVAVPWAWRRVGVGVDVISVAVGVAACTWPRRVTGMPLPDAVVRPVALTTAAAPTCLL